MFVVGRNLEELAEKYKIVDDIRDVDETCIELRLNKIVKRIKVTGENNMLKYGEKIPDEYVINEDISKSGLIIKPKEALLACSKQRIIIPRGYMGMIQTKGSLARMFVFVQCSDPQVDSGFIGNVTFEFFNASDFNVLLQEGQKVANLYLMPVSDKNVNIYKGKYNNATEPTIQLP